MYYILLIITYLQTCHRNREGKMYLNTHSHYSLRYGTMSPEALVRRAASYGIPVLPLTDINTTAGIFEFVRHCRQEGIMPVAGADIREEDRMRYTLLARSFRGLGEINRFLTRHNLSGEPYPLRAPFFREVYVIYPAGTAPAAPLAPHEYIGITPAPRHRLAARRGADPSRYVLLFPATFADETDILLHRHLRAIDHNTLLTSLPAGAAAGREELFLPPRHLHHAFHDEERLLANTQQLLGSCSFEFDFSSPKNKRTFTGDPRDDMLLLEKLARDGMHERYGPRHDEAARRIRHELEIIGRMGFAAYFLITWDMIRYAMSRGFHHVGRGSGANSVVAYCLGITDVDPIALDLYFERFINPRRSSPPDFDIDFSWKDRDKVVEYLFMRYGREHTALLGAFTTFRSRSLLRELGKVYGLPREEIDTLVHDPGRGRHRDAVARTLFAVAERLRDLPSGRTIHAGGLLIAEQPVTDYAALDLPPKGFPTTQWDMEVAESIGFEKLDVLSQRGIGHIGEATALIRRHHGRRIDVHAFRHPDKDPQVKELLRRGDTLGCFYIESPAMRTLLRKIQCDNYRSLVAASSIIRPGVARSGMMKEYIRRYRHPRSFRYLHPVMEELLSETFGIMVYQEDVLKVCHHYAGLGLDEADVLRRAMSGRHRSRQEMEKIAARFFAGAAALGRPPAVTQEVWRQIASFAGYSFSKAHSASYAVESLQSLWLKAHYPLEFMVAVINNFGGFYPTWVYLQEVRRAGGEVLLPCVNHSEVLTTLEGKKVYLGFVHLQGLEAALARRLAEERRRGGPYRDLADLVRRVAPPPRQLQLLIRADALRFTGRSRKELLWEATALTPAPAARHPADPALFPKPEPSCHLPPLEESSLEKAWDEIELLGFPVTLSWFDLLATSFRGEVKATEMLRHKGKKVRMAGLLVHVKDVRTVRHEWMHFGTWFDDRGTFFDTVHFPASLKKYPFRGPGVYLLLGRITEEFGVPSLEVEKMDRLPLRRRPGR